MDVFEATRLQTLYQELLPFGIEPERVFFENIAFMQRIAEDRSTLTLDADFEVIVNPPDLTQPKGMLFVSIHFDTQFACIPIFLAKQLAPQRPLTFLMSRQARAAVPAWKNELYTRAQKELGIDILYAEEPSSLLTVARRLRKKEAVFTFIDAIVPNAAANRIQAVQLLNRAVAMPTGGIEMALACQADVIPVFCRTTEGQHQLSFADALTNEQGIPDVAQAIANFFGRALLTAPDKWTQWDYCTANSMSEEPIEVLGLKKKASEVIAYRNENYLFDYQFGVLEKI